NDCRASDRNVHRRRGPQRRRHGGGRRASRPDEGPTGHRTPPETPDWTTPGTTRGEEMNRELFRSRFRFTAAVLAVSVLLATTLLVLTITVRLAPLERHYLVTYLLTPRSGSGKYRLLLIKHPKGTYLATDRDVAAIPP